MSYIKGIDVSRWQGDIDWNAVRGSGVEIAIIKMSGGDDGLYYDSKATSNYYAAKAAGLAVGCYHFAGGTDPTAEADYFLSACQPLEQDDVLVLDYEVSASNQVAWCGQFANRVHDRTGVWPMLYISGSRVNSFSGSLVLQNCGLWVAWWGVDPEGTLPISATYVMHQYADDGAIPGVAGRVDLDAWFGTVAQFKKYGYQSAEPTPTPTPQPTPVPVPDPGTVITPTPTPEPTPEPTPAPVTSDKWKAILAALFAAAGALVAAIINWIH